MSIKITEFERKTYDYIKEQGEMKVSAVPKMMWVQFQSLRMQASRNSQKTDNTLGVKETCFCKNS